MATKALANDVQLSAVHAIPGVPTTVARSADRAAVTAHLLDISKLAEPCRTCAARGGCHATRLMAMVPGYTASPRLHSRTLSQGEHVFYEGDEFNAVYVVRTGSVKSYLISTAGDEQVISFYLPGELLGLDALLGMGAHGSLAIALESTAICAIPVAHLEGFVRHAPGGLQWLLRLAGEEIAHCHHTQLMLNRMKAETRLSHFLLDLSRRFSERCYSAREFNLSMSRQDIGNHLGLALETVSRLMTRFQQDGLLEVNQRRQITILDAAGLAAR
jgi:CRP/FNR family transcriptional regulator